MSVPSQTFTVSATHEPNLLPLHILWPDVSVLKRDSELYTLIGYNEAPLSEAHTLFC